MVAWTADAEPVQCVTKIHFMKTAAAAAAGVPGNVSVPAAPLATIN